MEKLLIYKVADKKRDDYKPEYLHNKHTKTFDKPTTIVVHCTNGAIHKHENIKSIQLDTKEFIGSYSDLVICRGFEEEETGLDKTGFVMLRKDARQIEVL